MRQLHFLVFQYCRCNSYKRQQSSERETDFDTGLYSSSEEQILGVVGCFGSGLKWQENPRAGSQLYLGYEAVLDSWLEWQSAQAVRPQAQWACQAGLIARPTACLASLNFQRRAGLMLLCWCCYAGFSLTSPSQVHGSLLVCPLSCLSGCVIKQQICPHKKYCNSLDKVLPPMWGQVLYFLECIFALHQGPN